jgi:hypothetical protein
MTISLQKQTMLNPLFVNPGWNSAEEHAVVALRMPTDISLRYPAIEDQHQPVPAIEQYDNMHHRRKGGASR